MEGTTPICDNNENTDVFGNDVNDKRNDEEMVLVVVEDNKTISEESEPQMKENNSSADEVIVSHPTQEAPLTSTTTQTKSKPPCFCYKLFKLILF